MSPLAHPLRLCWRWSFWPIAVAVVVASAGCPSLRIDEPIALLPEESWSRDQVALLEASADCWNQQFGTSLVVRPASPLQQQVGVGFSDFVCLRALGRTETSLPVSFHVCPPQHFTTVPSEARLLLFQTFLHELGHVLNIRVEGRDPQSIMGMPALALPRRFADEDRRLLAGANAEVSVKGSCDVVAIEDCCRCSCR